MTRKVLIANRGEIAVRIIRACREMGLTAAVIYSDADRGSPHVLAADEAYRIGPPPATESYLKGEEIVNLAVKTHADAIHPGYGFLAENGDFARLCTEKGIVFIGPTHESMRLMGDKIEARRKVAARGVPTIPGTMNPVSSLEEARKVAVEVGFPLLLKASAGGGGKGMRRVESMDDLESALKRTTSEAQTYFASGEVYIEKFLDHPRHIEVQILADNEGNCVHLGERECSVQRRHQKVLEETPSPVVDPETRERLGELACKVAEAADYNSAGTVEFLRNGSGDFYFLEMNTRIQVEHPITEMVTGVDLVKEQISVAFGNPLSLTQEEISWRGHAVECRIYAEDPFRNFAPSPGQILRFRPAAGPGVRNDFGVDAGFTVPLDYDPLLGKLIVHGRNRTEALVRLSRALAECRIDGITTTVQLFEHVISDPDFIAGEYDTSLLEKLLPELHREQEQEAALAAHALAAIHYFQERKEKILAPQKAGAWRRCSWRRS